MNLRLPIDDWIGSQASDWLEAVAATNYGQAAGLAEETTKVLKGMLRDVDSGASENQRNGLYMAAIFFRSLWDFAILKQLTGTPGWSREPSKIEEAWIYYWDCRQRFDASGPTFGGTAVELVQQGLKETAEWFDRTFGPGVYSSPEILVKKQVCSICAQDFRACSHILGRLYGGKRCVRVAQGIQPNGMAVALVTEPLDPRCRIWPWQREGNHLKGICLMTMFQIDDFLLTEDEY